MKIEETAKKISELSKRNIEEIYSWKLSTQEETSAIITVALALLRAVAQAEGNRIGLFELLTRFTNEEILRVK